MRQDGPPDLFVAPGDRERLWVANELMTLIATGDDTGNRYAPTDSVVPPMGEPPLHVHHREDEGL